MRQTAFALVGLLLTANLLHAHLHDDVEQQALLSIGLDRATLEIRIIPSFDEGATVFAHLDSDADGTVSADEASSFGIEILSRSNLVVNDLPVDLGNLRIIVPQASQISSGQGVISVTTNANFPALNGARTSVHFEITYAELSNSWFIQPFFFADLNRTFSMDTLVRSSDGTRVDLTFIWNEQ